MRRKRGGRERDVDLEVRKHTNLHASKHAHTPIHARARARTLTHTRTHACARAHAHSHAHTNTRTHVHTHIHIKKTLKKKNIDTQFKTHTRAHWHTHSHTHTHIHTNYVCADPLGANGIGRAAGTVYKPSETLPASHGLARPVAAKMGLGHCMQCPAAAFLRSSETARSGESRLSTVLVGDRVGRKK